MEYEKEGLVSILKEASLATAKNKHVPYFNFFRFHDNKIKAQNGRLYYENAFPSELNCFVPASKMKAVIAKMGDTVSLTQNDDRSITVESDKNQTRIATGKKYPQYSEPEVAGETYLLPETLIPAIGKVVSSTSKDLTQPLLLGVHITADNVVATDRNRITSVVVEGMDFLTKGLTLTKEACQALLEVDGLTSITVGDMAVEFSDDVRSLRVISPIIAGDYPASAISILNLSTDERKRIEIPLEIKDAVERVALMSPTDVPNIRLFSSGNGLLHMSSNDTPGSSFESFPVEAQSDFDFLINPEYLLDTLTSCNTLFYDRPGTPLLFRDEKFVSLISPIIP